MEKGQLSPESCMILEKKGMYTSLWKSGTILCLKQKVFVKHEVLEFLGVTDLCAQKRLV